MQNRFLSDLMGLKAKSSTWNTKFKIQTRPTHRPRSPTRCSSLQRAEPRFRRLSGTSDLWTLTQIAQGSPQIQRWLGLHNDSLLLDHPCHYAIVIRSAGVTDNNGKMSSVQHCRMMLSGCMWVGGFFFIRILARDRKWVELHMRRFLIVYMT